MLENLDENILGFKGRSPAVVLMHWKDGVARTYRDNPGKLVELAGLLGHDSLDTTALYTRSSRDDLAADLERSRFNVDG